MEQVNPTRMELIRKNAQIKMAEQGRDLLRQKMDVLVREFFQVMESFSRSRDELEAVANDAQRSLLLAEAIDDPITLKSASFATRKSIMLEVRDKNIMGVPVPVIEKKSVSRSVIERGYGIVGTSGRLDETAEKFEAELDMLIDLAEKETAMRRLGAGDPDEPEARQRPRAAAHTRAEKPGTIHQDLHRGERAGRPVPAEEGQEAA